MPLDPENDETVALGIARTPVPNSQRFAPGTLLASRYRIVSRLGKGGMGEVFRADDIMLGQPVALKFLPEHAARNVNLLTRFYDEVRIARQISHANVCRVYDIGEIDGQPYLSMEYIDGEDLSSLLRRIGRLPGDKAAEFARKMCAGLAAAHAQGVLHRDIKPGNIMIDGRGEPRITDFGLAAVAASIDGNEIRNGTPAYMAPEQLEGREVTVQSDLYALGLVFHEMFTGKAAHDAPTVAELTRLRKETRTTKASTLVADLDPAVDRAVQACLDPDPKLRPKSALDLARMLPGGDPLAAALAAGQTPSPEMVAAAGSKEGMRIGIASALVLVTLAGLGATLWLGSNFQIANHAPLEKPDVLESKARDIVRSLGYTDAPADSAVGFGFDYQHRAYQWMKQMDKETWSKALQVPPSPISFWYRQSPAPLAAEGIRTMGRVVANDPPLITAGMVSAEVAMDGRLLSFTAVPPEKIATKADAFYDWAPLFTAAKLDMASFTPVDPEWTPVVAADQRAAWTGLYPGKDNLQVRIEAGAFQDKPVYFSTVWPWTSVQRTVRESSGLATRRAFARNAYTAVGWLIAIAAVILARINVKVGRVDFRGANWLAVFLVVTNMIVWVLRAHHVTSAAEQTLWFAALADALGTGMMAWVVYLALEPWVRRYWPQALISWTRMIGGGWRDPLVGRDILIALATGLFAAAYFCVIISLDGLTVGDFQFQQLISARYSVQVIANDLAGAISAILIYFMLMFLLRVVIGKTWIVSAAFVLLWGLYRGLNSGADNWWISAAIYVPIILLFVTLLNRYGFLATVLSAFVTDTSLDLVMTMDLTAWYGQSTLIMIILWLAMMAWGFRLAVGNRTLLDTSVLAK